MTSAQRAILPASSDHGAHGGGVLKCVSIGTDRLTMADATQPPIDSQQVEIVGRNLLISRLVSSGIEVARPERDRGVDLIAYLDLDCEVGFRALPLQLKAYSAEGVLVDRKYERLSDLHVVFAWHVREPELASFFCLSPAELLAVATSMGWTETKSWEEGGKYSTSDPSRRLVDLLEPHEMVTAADWLGKIRRLPNEGAA